MQSKDEQNKMSNSKRTLKSTSQQKTWKEQAKESPPAMGFVRVLVLYWKMKRMSSKSCVQRAVEQITERELTQNTDNVRI